VPSLKRGYIPNFCYRNDSTPRGVRPAKAGL
jgi:hypothetical protein